MNQSEDIKELATALAKAQGAIEGALKDKENPHFRSKYADLGAVWDACREALSVNGVSVVQPVTSRSEQLCIVTRLMHSSGQWMEDDGMPLLLGKQDMQGLGSACTYARRYGLMAMVGIAPEDDDGNAAAASAKGNVSPVKRATPTPASQKGSTVMGDGGPVPVGLTADDKPDWGGWCAILTLRLDQCTDVIQVNALHEMHAAGFANLRHANAKWADELERRFDIRRGNLAQKPAA